MRAKPPNILIVQADQMAAPALPFYGHPLVRAPHMAALAEHGVVFENAYCNSPLCAPSRFSMLAGLMPSEIGAYDNSAEFPAALPTFAHHLRGAGYRTLLAGKMHFVGPDQLHGFEERLTTDIYPADFGWTPNWEAPEARQDYFHTMQGVVEAGPCARSMQIDFDEEVAHQSVRRIYDLARADDPRPFLLLVSFSHPHDPFTITPEYWERYAEDEIDPPAVPAIPYRERDPHSRRLYELCDMGRYALTEARVLSARRAYYGAISYIDDKVGALMAALEAAGLAEDTVVVLTSDHGEMLGERGMWYKMTFYEWAARVPFVVHAPGRLAPARVGENVSLLDLCPTLVDLAGAGAEAEPLPGNSLVPLMAGDAQGWPDAVHGEYLAEGAAGPLVMIRRGAYKYVRGEAAPAQLFDLEADPQELANLAGVPAQRGREAAFAEEAAERWDFAALRRRVLTSQRRRRLVFEALRQGRPAPWDFEPRQDTARLYARNLTEALGELERRARLPRAEEPPPDGSGD
jgi:choline-sulfatase